MTRIVLFFATLVVVHILWFGQAYQGVYYFGILGALYGALQRKNAFLPLPIGMALWSVVFIDSIGNFYDWYGTYTWYDNLSHASGTAAITLFACYLLHRSYPTLLPWHSAGIGMLCGTTIAALYEIWEYWAQHISGIRFIWGEFDTTLDLQWNILGAVVMAIAWMIAQKRITRLKK